MRSCGQVARQGDDLSADVGCRNAAIRQLGNHLRADAPSRVSKHCHVQTLVFEYFACRRHPGWSLASPRRQILRCKRLAAFRVNSGRGCCALEKRQRYAEVDMRRPESKTFVLVCLNRRRFLASGRSILYHRIKSDSQRAGIGQPRHGKNSRDGEADSGYGKRQTIHMKRKRCAKCSGKGTVLCAVCGYLSDKRAATHYGWISPFSKARYAQAPARSGRHKRKSVKF